MKSLLFKALASIIGLIIFTACSKDDLDNSSDIVTTDNYVGEQYQVILGEEMSDFDHPHFVCYLKADDGSVISRSGDHVRLNDLSTLTFDVGLKDGIYRLLYLEVDDNQYGLGCRVDFIEGQTPTILDPYNSEFRMSGNGTEYNPFCVSCSDHLRTIRDKTNDDVSNEYLTSEIHFKQTADIDMYSECYKSHHDFGWLPIGHLSNTPFRGVYDGGGYKITNFWCYRTSSSGVGLFGFVEDAYIKRVNMENPDVKGLFAVGSIIGATISSAEEKTTTYLYDCSTSNGSVGDVNKGESLGTGGLVGAVDMYSKIAINGCQNINTEVSGGYGVGGILGIGSVTSQTYVEDCENGADITSNYTGAGGIVGTVDSLSVIGCINTGKISGSKSYASGGDNGYYGTGGIAGGSGCSIIDSSINRGDVEGYIGVGGIIGSSRIAVKEVSGEADVNLMFNNVMLSTCSNSGNICGYTSVGGLNGESQLGCVESYNGGSVTATSKNCCLGGIAGNTAIAVIHNSVNSGDIYTTDGYAVGGIVGQSTWGSLFANQNYGDINANSSYLGGFAAILGNYSIVNYCSNGGILTNRGTGVVGGVVGAIGDPNEMNTMDIAHCVVGAVDCALGITGAAFAIVGEMKIGSAIFKECVHVLEITHKLVDKAAWVSEVVLLGFGSNELANEEEVEFVDASVKLRVEELSGEVAEEMSGIRRGYSINGVILPEFDAVAYDNYLSNLDKVVDFYNESEENNEHINYNLNMKRELRYEEVEKQVRRQEIVQEVISGVCVAVIAVASIASVVATGGATTPVVAELVSIGATIVAGTNCIVMGTTDFANNAAVVSQCVNFGDIDAPNSDRVGGLVGELFSYVQLENCLNIGSGVNGTGDNKKSGGFISLGENRSEITNCLNVGVGYMFADGVDIAHTEESGLFFYDDQESYDSDDYGIYDIVGLDFSNLHKKTCYDICGWQLQDNEKPLWYLNDKDGYFPIPYLSEMMY